MSDKLFARLDKIFGPYDDLNNIRELKEELYSDLLEKMNDFISQGYDEDIALEKTICSLGDISELIEEICSSTRDLQMQVGVDFSKSTLKGSDMRNVKVKGGKFNYSEMAGSDFTNSILQDSVFKCSNLVKCHFDNSELSGVEFNKSNLAGSTFQNATINKTKFNFSDLKGVSFDGLKITSSSFDYSGLKGTSFKNTTLINVSFKTVVKKSHFDGASMDRLTYTMLKGYGADLKGVTVL
jgi:uncharacterized protein YjbI with pentapeptide repeats